MEYIDSPTLKSTIEAYGWLDITNVKFVAFSILQLLKDLLKIDLYHGRLNTVFYDVWSPCEFGRILVYEFFIKKFNVKNDAFVLTVKYIFLFFVFLI